MDVTLVISRVLSTLGQFIPLLQLLGLLTSPWTRGSIGERLVRLFARLELDQETYLRQQRYVEHPRQHPADRPHMFRARKRADFWKRKASTADTETRQTHVQVSAPPTEALHTFQSAGGDSLRSCVASHSAITVVNGSALKIEMHATPVQGIRVIRNISSLQHAELSKSEVDTMSLAHRYGQRAPTIATTWEQVQNLNLRNDSIAKRQRQKYSCALLFRAGKPAPKAG